MRLNGQENYQIDSTSKWIQKEIWGDSDFIENCNFTLSIQGDTILNDTLYYKMFSNGQRIITWHGYDPHFEYIENEYYGAVRQNSGEVYFIPANETYSLKLYDFNYSTGDTISSYAGKNFIIQNVDTLENGRKRFYTNAPEQLIIIEGIGSNWGFIETHPGFEFSQILGCYYQNDLIEYMNDEEVCNFIITNIQETALRSNIYPNPVTENLFIDKQDFINSVEIFDLNGIRQNAHFVRPNKVDVSMLSAGVYILEINHKSGILFIKK